MSTINATVGIRKLSIKLADVIMFESKEKYIDVTYWCTEAKKFKVVQISDTLKNLLKLHPEFTKVHRGRILRLDTIVRTKEYEHSPHIFAVVKLPRVKLAIEAVISRRNESIINDYLKARRLNASKSA